MEWCEKHPERAVRAKGACQSCYQTWYRTSRRWPDARDWSQVFAPCRCGCGDAVPGLWASGHAPHHDRYRDGLTAKQRYHKKIKAAAFDYYGWSCACCGEKEPVFLTLDHVNNDGNEQRARAVAQGFASSSYEWVSRNGYPEDVQTLCYNCNFGKARNQGVCPHNAKEFGK